MVFRNVVPSLHYFVAVLKRTDKEKLVRDLVSALAGAPAAVVASFQTLPMGESAMLRRALRASGGRLRVVPKRLFRRVAEQLGWSLPLDAPDSVLVAWSTDLLAPAKALREYVRAHEEAKFLGGALEGKPLDESAAGQLASLPPVDVLRGQFVSVLAGPLRGIVGVFRGVLRGLSAVLQAKARANHDSRIRNQGAEQHASLDS